ncbi:hypothetical protein RHGRI_020261 [Rhododendron griersonianum]|uniref:DUF4218 domain-containing protein n=1 Tax=Rhododendron griersonianum TaxID=479676 RepID=A0AAV6JJW3_9ERIC|nr:hypothetical protein RHGRI_020261 [Rhododendron griersonianum]
MAPKVLWLWELNLRAWEYLATLKSYVRNKNRPEGSIAEGYLAEECLTFCSRYLEDVETRFNRVGRNDDEGSTVAARLPIFSTQGRPFGKVVTETLDQETQHQTMIRDQNPRLRLWEIQRMHNEKFASWFGNYVQDLQLAEDEQLSEELRALARGPDDVGKRYREYIINGFRFHTREVERRRKSQNSGVVVTATTSFSSASDNNPVAGDIAYYGVLTDESCIDDVETYLQSETCDGQFQDDQGDISLVREDVQRTTIDTIDATTAQVEMAPTARNTGRALLEPDSNQSQEVNMNAAAVVQPLNEPVKRDHYDSDLPIEEQIHSPPDRVQADQWKELVKYWHEDAKKFYTKNKSSRAGQNIIYKKGKTPLAIVREAEAKNLGHDPSRAHIFLTCFSNVGKVSNEELRKKIEKMKELSEQVPEGELDSSGPNDVFSKAMGKEKSGSVRMYGLGSQANGANSSNTRVTSPNIPVTSPNQHSGSSTSTTQRGRVKVGDCVYFKSVANPIEVVGKWQIASMDPSTEVGGVELGVNWCEIDSCSIPIIWDEHLMRPYAFLKTVGNAIGTPIAWPISLVVRDDDDGFVE